MGDFIPWLCMAILLCIVEVLTGTFFCLVFAVAVVAGGIVSIFNDGSLPYLVTASLTIIGCIWIAYRRSKKTKEGLDDSARIQNIDVGQKVHVKEFVGSRARVSYRGTPWDAMSYDGSDLSTGEWEIVKLKGNCLIIKKA